MKKLFLLTVFSICFTCSPYSLAGMTADELEQWFNEDDTPTPVQVDKGELVFLLTPPPEPALHTINKLTLNQNSIDNGWVKLTQCFKHLDPIGRTDVVYRYKYLRTFNIVSTSHIGKATINNQTIELEDVGENAELCIKAEARIFYQNTDGTFSLSNGPFHRKFLDGYFPYHVTLDIQYPESKLIFVKSLPGKRPGFNLKKEKNRLIVDTHFAGTLKTEIVFKARKHSPVN